LAFFSEKFDEIYYQHVFTSIEGLFF